MGACLKKAEKLRYGEYHQNLRQVREVGKNLGGHALVQKVSRALAQPGNKGWCSNPKKK